LRIPGAIRGAILAAMATHGPQRPHGVDIPNNPRQRGPFATDGGLQMQQTYVHGYHTRESTRLQDQAQTLEDLLHGDTV
jgi:hypothetical protein